MVNFNYAAKYGTAFEDFGSWVDVSYEEFLYDMTQQPEVFHINSHVPFIGFSKRKLTNTGRVAKNESVWIPIKECVAITSPSSNEVLLLVPNLNDKVLPRLTHWAPGVTSDRPQFGAQKYSGYTKRFIDAFVETGNMNWDRPIIPLMGDEGNRTRFKNKLHQLLIGLNLSWHNPDYYSMGYGRELDVGRRNKHYETQTEIEEEAREKFLSAVFQNANAMNENYEEALPTEPPYYLQYVVDKQTFLDNLQAAKNQYDYVETDLGGVLWHASGFLNIKVLTEIRGLSPQGKDIKLLNWTTSKNLLDYLDIAPNPLRPFLWELELVNDKHGNLVPYGTSYTGRWGISPKYRGIHGLLPLGKWRSVSPRKEWQNYSLDIESDWDRRSHWGQVLEAETFEAGSKYPPKYLDLSQTGTCFVATPHFQEQWNDNNRYGPSETKSLPDLLGSWRDGKPWFWEQLLTAPIEGNFYHIRVRTEGVVVAYIKYTRRFNRSRGRQEIELVTVTPPSIPSRGLEGFTITGRAHSDTTEWPKHSLSFNAETFNSMDVLPQVMAAHNNSKGYCPICSGPIPNAEDKGKYPGAMSRYDNETEICSLCGSAEALAPMMDDDAGVTMKVGYQNRDWELWRQGVKIGRSAVKVMMVASAQAAKRIKEGKVQIEDITDKYMEGNE